MKRKKINEPISNFKRKKTLDYTKNNFNDKSILDFWKPKENKKETKKKLKSKSKERTMSQDSNNTNNSKRSCKLVKNPSNHSTTNNGLFISNTNTNKYPDYKNKILFSEEFIRKLKISLEPFLFQSQLEPIDEYSKFIQDNIDSLLTKFLLQINDNFFFVPISYMDKREDTDKSKIKLLEGFNNNKIISLQYYPIKSKEIVNQDLSSNIIAYLKYFNRNRSHNYKNSKALVICDENYIDLIKTIETICSDRDYKVIRLDELENGKINKLNKVSEATQSQRISCLPEALNDKLKILERIVSNNSHSQKLNSLRENEIYTYSNNNSGVSFSSTTTSETITHYFTQDTQERSLYNAIQDNVYHICAKKKTLILIVDSFITEDDKAYLSGIINKISLTKCPFVILTNNLNFAKSDNLFNNSIKTITNHFIFHKVDNYDKISENNTIFLCNLILLLHLLVQDTLEEILINEANFSLDSFISKIKEIFTTDYLECLKSKNIFSRISKIALHVCLMNDFSLDRIFLYINNILRFNMNTNNANNSIIFNMSNTSSLKIELKLEIFEMNLKNPNSEFCKLKDFMTLLEKKSFDNFKMNKCKNISRKTYDDYYFNIHRLNKQIQKNDAITKKSFFLNKNNEQLINCEEILINNFLNLDMKLKNENILEEFTYELIKEDKLFYNSLLLNKATSVDKNNLHEYNSLLQKFLEMFDIRKPRSTRKLIKDKDLHLINEEHKLNAFVKIFKGINNNLLERYFKIHSCSDLIYRDEEENFFFRNFNRNFFSDYKIYEELSIQINFILGSNELQGYSVNSGDELEFSSYLSEEEDSFN